ncbi:MAG: hypothetical protein ACTSRP_03595, partial [Candidatus Helarchaeota archaeon]
MEIKIISNSKLLLGSKILIVIFTILILIFPWHGFIYLGHVYTENDLIFFIFKYVLLAAICLDFLIIIDTKKIFRILGEIGVYISVIAFVIYIILFFLVIALNSSKISDFWFNSGYYFLICIIILEIFELFYIRRLKKEESPIQSTDIESLQVVVESEPAISENLKKKKKSKSFLKKGLKTIGKSVAKTAGETVAKAAGDAIGDKMSELTGNNEIGKLVGKVAQAGMSTLTSKAIDAIDNKLSRHPESDERGMVDVSNVSMKQVGENVFKLTKINFKNSIKGIIKAKQFVSIDYIQNILKLPKNIIIALIYELIGAGQIEGRF